MANTRVCGLSKATSILLLFVSIATAQQSLVSTSFSPCLNDNQVAVAAFNVTITPGSTLAYNLTGESSFLGNDTIDVSVINNGASIYQNSADPCSTGIAGLCPINTGPIIVDASEEFMVELPTDVLTTNNLDMQVRLRLNNTATGQPFLCVEATMSNGREQVEDSNSTSPTSTSSPSVSSSGPEPTQSKANAVSLGWNLSMILFCLVVFCANFA